MAYTDNIRISDSEREQIVGELGRHLTAGRLTIGEFDQRVAQVYRSITRHEAQQALMDLPAQATAPVPEPKPTAPARPALRRLPAHQQIEWLAWLAAGTINLAIWGIISVATGTMLYFWPVWVIGPWGLVLLSRTLLGREGTCGAFASAVRDDRLRATARS
ncbi:MULTISPECIES: DUF1707 domain-containing protein [unclassified Rhodococcus (in: high G+C Gram-positive bacteria)]|uniref:DUF1707 SHOCT-like domain-containing protein n=1 Tax=unclassified Rhodococcus (in: high G+C Gram-positive bacteria) TaxID=192944 RepID=UPI0016399CA2|nr:MULTISPECIES: DUF1707 domain-containing protein [unclassified Rhodococcus (in: high G+C Gram-positive bacteria)]MBC2642596.1 DUF1707 domain-containing protein [Rhodococcus sp. 3A]MBC2892662.1 DUF1707 domain-containing protein [Rhodococcus sp. 4CII]